MIKFGYIFSSSTRTCIIFLFQGPGAGAEDHQERGQVQGGRQARGQRARKAAGEGPPGQAVTHHHHHQHHDHHNCHHQDDQIVLPTW